MKFTPNDQWPQPRSLKDDPPPDTGSGRDILVSRGSGWCRCPCDEVKRLIETGYTHWLSMPPDPPKPKQAWEERWGEWFGINAITTPPTSSDAFKAGWNAALEAVFDKTRDIPIEELKAP